MFWRHVVASNAEAERAGNDEYRDNHMSAIHTEGLSFSGFERDYVSLNMGGCGHGGWRHRFDTIL